MTISEFQGEYRFLSNFYMTTVSFNGVEYSSVEHAYQALKTTDLGIRSMIMSAKTPGEAKRLARRVELRKHWEEYKVPLMCKLVESKFHSSPVLQARLLATGEAYLQEGNRWGDQFWGIDLRSGIGKNQLGLILMSVRDKLRSTLTLKGRVI